MNFKLITKVLNIFLTGVVLVLLVAKVPLIYANFKTEGTQAEDFSVPTNKNRDFYLKDITENKVVIFWATWCPPCELELSRVNGLIKDKKIKAESVLAISINEEKKVVDRVVAERGYEFLVGYDFDGQISKKYSVQGTPTLVFIDKDKSIHWLSTGLSPFLSLRTRMFLE